MRKLYSQCSGCGADFIVGAGQQSLYCSESCQKGHTLFQQNEGGYPMKDKAIEKIKAEMDKEKGGYFQHVGKFLLDCIETNPVASEKIMVEGKTISKSIAAMKKEAKKVAVNGCGILTDEEGFKIVLKYYGIKDQLKEKNSTDKVAAVVNQVNKTRVKFDVRLEDLL
ncbi:hypothetical protein F7732_21330 [Bacillus mesophilum]|uniref:Uncharacterized protein n=2 Tax=Bacillus mesophilum TaxID=1071718 RepID=A0A7V7RHZ2_9BACI|nr:hypothetical protein F7732_21330 [Bacillus mesophilum]